VLNVQDREGILTTSGGQDSRTPDSSELKTSHGEVVCLFKNHRLVQPNTTHTTSTKTWDVRHTTNYNTLVTGSNTLKWW
jgi:hypothetical protein